MSLDLEGFAAKVERELEAFVNPERRKHAEGYFTSHMRILGVAVPDLRRVAKTMVRELADEPPQTVLAAAHALREAGTHEGRQVGYEMLALRKDTWPLLRFRELQRLGKGNDNWASVDALATSLVGRAWLDGRVTDAQIARWAVSKDRWWRRTALAATVCLNLKSRGGSGDPERTLVVCHLLVDDHDPMVAKALSWALRSVVPHDAAAVESFLDRYGARIAAFVRREVNNKLDSGRKSGTR